FAFLSFFPLIALAFAVVGYAVEVDPNARSYLETAIDEQLPGLSQQLPIDQVAQARTGAGVIGLLGLAYTGLGAVGALREALHTMWMKSVSDGPNFLVAKAIDLAVTAVLGTALLASVALTGVAQAATGWLLGLVGLDGSFTAAAATRLLGLAIAIGADLLIFLVLFSRLSGTRRPWRLLWRGALLAAVGFEVLKAAGALLIGGTLANPVYASFAVLVGLLVWLNIVLRMVMFAAAWTATWLPVPPPYQGAVPVDLPVGPAPTGAGLAVVAGAEPHAAERPAAGATDRRAGRSGPGPGRRGRLPPRGAPAGPRGPGWRWWPARSRMRRSGPRRGRPTGGPTGRAPGRGAGAGCSGVSCRRPPRRRSAPPCSPGGCASGTGNDGIPQITYRSLRH